MGKLQNKRTLVAGGTSGVGLKTAKQFVAEGARAATTGTNPKAIAAAQAELGDFALVLQADAASAMPFKQPFFWSFK